MIHVCSRWLGMLSFDQLVVTANLNYVREFQNLAQPPRNPHFCFSGKHVDGETLSVYIG